jgi:hypothetical protein
MIRVEVLMALTAIAACLSAMVPVAKDRLAEGSDFIKDRARGRLALRI